MSPLAWMLGAISLWCLALGVSGAVIDWWEQRHPAVGCNLDDDCADCRDVRREQI